MVLWKLFFTNPLMACALCACLATIYGCIVILRKRHQGPDRFLAALIGIVCVWQGLRILRVSGVFLVGGSHSFETIAELIVTGLYLLATIILRISVIERKTAQVRLRLEEANGQMPCVMETHDQQVSEIILGSNPLAAIALDKSGRVTYWNSTAESLLGWRSEEVVGRTSPVPMSSPLRTKDGSLIRFQSWCSPLRDALGRPCGTVFMIAPRAERRANRFASARTILAAAGFPGGSPSL